MIKLFCDRCEKEASRLFEIKIPTKETAFGFETESKNVCKECEKEANKIYEQLREIRFILFQNFIKGADTE